MDHHHHQPSSSSSSSSFTASPSSSTTKAAIPPSHIELSDPTKPIPANTEKVKQVQGRIKSRQRRKIE